MSRYLVYAAEPVSPRGLEKLAATGQIEVVSHQDVPLSDAADILSRMHGLIVRSATKVNAEFLARTPALKVVGRAGVGVDNVDVDAATSRGVLVMNTPGGNTISTAEHALSLIFALARSIPQAHASIVAGQWNRKAFVGVELYGKTLGILGMGRIGSEVARRAVAMGMRVRAYDPFLTAARANTLQVELCETVESLLPECDFLTVHTPLTPESKGILSAPTFALCKPGVRIVNCARGGLVNETDLLAALESGQVAGAALDVFETEPPPEDWPLRNHPRLVLTPHLGASTEEAQENVGIEVAEQIADYLLKSEVRNSVNLPSIDAKTMEILGPFLNLGRRLGLLAGQFCPKRAERLDLRYYGWVTEYSLAPITRAVLEGFLRPSVGDALNPINVTRVAETRGLRYSESKRHEYCDFAEMLEIEVSAGSESVIVAGTLFAGQARLVAYNNRNVDSNLEGVLMLFENTDRPGIIGWLGTLMARHNVNIANMSLSRNTPGGKALTILQLDSLPSKQAVDEVSSEPDISGVRIAQF